jgi:hypothetical protein
VTSPAPGRAGRGAGRDDAGGVWIITGILLGALVYAGMVLMLVAGFTAIVPFVVIPPVIVAMIGANSLLGGGRPSRPARAPSGPIPPPAAAGGTAPRRRPNGQRPGPPPGEESAGAG